jgi:Secretion system C-terminal sorting domain
MSATDKTSYSLTDIINSSQSGLIYYRLRSVDVDEKYKYSETRIIRVDRQTQSTLLVYPNPVRNELRITLPFEWQNKRVKYELVAANGQTVKRLENIGSSQTETMNISNLVPGVYIMRIRCNAETTQQKIIKD